MKAVTVRQPWASLIMLGVKRIETRSWNTKHRGPLAIHAGSAMPCGRGATVTFGDFEVERDNAGLLLRSPRLSWPYRLPVGCLLGSVLLFQTRKTDSHEYKPPPDELPLGDHSPGRFGWYFESGPRRLLHPVPCRGALGLWTVPADVEDRLEAVAA